MSGETYAKKQLTTINFKLRESDRRCEASRAAQKRHNLAEVERWSQKVAILTMIRVLIQQKQQKFIEQNGKVMWVEGKWWINWTAISIQLHRYKPWRWIMVWFKIINNKLQHFWTLSMLRLDLIIVSILYETPEKLLLCTSQHSTKTSNTQQWSGKTLKQIKNDLALKFNDFPSILGVGGKMIMLWDLESSSYVKHYPSHTKHRMRYSATMSSVENWKTS